MKHHVQNRAGHRIDVTDRHADDDVADLGHTRIGEQQRKARLSRCTERSEEDRCTTTAADDQYIATAEHLISRHGKDTEDETHTHVDADLGRRGGEQGSDGGRSGRIRGGHPQVQREQCHFEADSC